MLKSIVFNKKNDFFSFFFKIAVFRSISSILSPKFLQVLRRVTHNLRYLVESGVQKRQEHAIHRPLCALFALRKFERKFLLEGIFLAVYLRLPLRSHLRNVSACCRFVSHDVGNAPVIHHERPRQRYTESAMSETERTLVNPCAYLRPFLRYRIEKFLLLWKIDRVAKAVQKPPVITAISGGPL